MGPLWIKPTGVENIQDHLSVVPPHQIEATKFLTVQRDVASMPQPLLVADAVDHEVSSSGSTSARGESTDNEDSDDDLELHASARAQNRLENDVDSHRVNSLVASLRDARIRANLRRVALGSFVRVY